MPDGATATAWSAVSDLLPQAMGIALSPMPIVALIVLLTLPGGRPRGLGFALGGLAGLILAGTALTFASGPAPGQDAAAPSATSSVVKLALGLFMWAFAYRTWKHRDDGGQPGWMTTLETLGFGKAFLFGAGMMVVNPKNLPILGAAALSVSGAGLQGGAQLWAMAIFGVAGPRARRADGPRAAGRRRLADRAQRRDHDGALRDPRREHDRQGARRPLRPVTR